MASKSANVCPYCAGPISAKYVIGGRCNHPFHTRDAVRKGRKSAWRTFSDRGDTVRSGDAELTDQDPEDRTFGGPGRRIVTVDEMLGGAEEHPTCEEECCVPKKKKPKRRKRAGGEA